MDRGTVADGNMDTSEPPAILAAAWQKTMKWRNTTILGTNPFTFKCYLQTVALTTPLLVAACFPVYGGVESSQMIGGGEPGLHIVYETTNQFAIYLDEPWTVGSFLIGGYDKRHIDVLLDRNYGLKEKILTREWVDNPEQLYPFDNRTVFTCDGGRWNSDGKTWNYWPRHNRVFSINGDSISVANDVYALARQQYGLTSNQLFLGKIGTNVYYWETQDSRKVFYRPAAEKMALNYFELPAGIIDILGGVKGVKKDVGFVVIRYSPGAFHYSPVEFTFIEFSFKDAKQVKSDQ